MSNLGIDFGIWKDKLSGTIDLYDRLTSDLFSSTNISAVVGAGPSLIGNNGELRNRGVELSLKYKIVNNDNLTVAVFANGSYNKNEYESIEYAIRKVHNVVVKRDTKWYNSTLEKQAEFWNDVQKARNNEFVLAEPKYKRQKQCMIVEEST
jgi:hypothetical protein